MSEYTDVDPGAGTRNGRGDVGTSVCLTREVVTYSFSVSRINI